MNYLGHFYLSGNDAGVIFGNFIGDVVKGSRWKSYPAGVSKGILLHRFIDGFTDNHPIVKQAKDRIRPYFALTSSIVVDMYFDHFLSKYWHRYHRQTLGEFLRHIYGKLDQFKEEMPSYTGILFSKMQSGNWITSYKTVDGIAFALTKMGRRVKFENNWEMAGEVLRMNYQALENDFHGFFPEMIRAVSGKTTDKCD